MDEHGREIVVMGRGIAFGRKLGDPVDAEKVEKTFSQVDQQLTGKLVSLLAEIPLDCFQFVEQIIQNAKVRIGRKLNENLIITLTDHIFFAIKRIREGIIVKNGLLWETKRIYPEEFAIGKQALQQIEEKYQVSLPEDEAAFIALHLINAQLDEEIPTIMAMTKIMKNILEIVRIHFRITFDEESLDYFRFITHLKYFTQRLVTSKLYSDDQDDELYQMVRKKYPETYRCSEKIRSFVQSEHNYILTNEEIIYFTVHLERLINNTKD